MNKFTMNGQDGESRFVTLVLIVVVSLILSLLLRDR